MNKALIYFILFVFLSSQTEMHRLWSLPSIVIHYFHHCNSTDDYSWIDYVHEHCLDQDDCDSKCNSCHFPLDACSQFSHISTLAVIPSLIEFSLLSQECPSIMASSYSERFFCEPNAEIWQPPQL